MKNMILRIVKNRVICFLQIKTLHVSLFANCHMTSLSKNIDVCRTNLKYMIPGSFRI